MKYPPIPHDPTAVLLLGKMALSQSMSQSAHVLARWKLLLLSLSLKIWGSTVKLRVFFCKKRKLIFSLQPLYFLSNWWFPYWIIFIEAAQLPWYEKHHQKEAVWFCIWGLWSIRIFCYSGCSLPCFEGDIYALLLTLAYQLLLSNHRNSLSWAIFASGI